MKNDAPIWTPSAERIAASRMHRFLQAHRERLEREDYAALHRWSVGEPEAFWAAVWSFCELRATRPWSAVLTHGDRMPGARWFDGAELNYTDNLLRPEHTATAIVYCNERGERRSLERAELRAQVASVARALRDLGVEPGDRVAAVLPNQPETIVAALAAASLGAIWSSCSPDFGLGGIVDRFGQIAPKVLFATEGYDYNGRHIDTRATVQKLCTALPGLAHVVMVPYDASSHARGTSSQVSAPGKAAPPARGAGSKPGITTFGDLLDRPAELDCVSLPFAHPLAILYSSGTTGVPKCIVHSAGGTLLQHQKEHVLHTDIGPGDVVFYFTTCGWMMWNWLVSTLACGATVVLYDGAPLYPTPDALWNMAEREGVTVFGTSAKYLAAIEEAGAEPGRGRSLERLRAVLSTGSPLAPASFDYVYRAIKRDVQLASISGGTDIVSCFALGNSLLPVYRGELQCLGLGMDVHIFDEDGHAVRGRKGELVCVSPFPSMPLGFWNDPDGRRYHAAYFERFDGVWWHGDYAELTEHGGLIMHGRSDTVLNPGGVRIGTAEIYRVVEQLPEVAESIVIGQDWHGDVRVVLFVKPAPDVVLDDALRDRIRLALRTEASPRHVPAKIVAVEDIPRTRSGKLVELAVRDVVHGREVANLSAIANPEALDQFRDRDELAE